MWLLAPGTDVELRDADWENDRGRGMVMGVQVGCNESVVELIN